MQTVKIPLFTPLYKALDESELRDECAEFVDGVLDERGVAVKRPGLVELADLSANAIDGLFWWGQRGYAIAVASGTVYKLEYSNGVLSATDITTVRLVPGARVSAAFADYPTDSTYYALLTNGDQIVYTDGTTATAQLTGTNVPAKASHLAYLDGYVLANEYDTNRYKWSHATLVPLVWDNAGDYASASGKGDFIKSLGVYNREIYLIGGETTEVWENDGTTPFSRVPGGFMEVGTIAPHSLVMTEQGVYFLSNDKRLMLTNGRDISRLSTPYDSDIATFPNPSDCISDKLTIRGIPYLIFHFVSAQKTLVYNEVQQNWSSWGNWNSDGDRWDRWLGNAVCACPDWNIDIVGARNSGKIYRVSTDAYDDAGAEIRVLRRTGHIDYGVLKNKRSERMRIRLKRGFGGYTSEPKFMFRWRQNNADWSPWEEFSLGLTGDSSIVLEINRRGIFRTRQYEFACTASVPVSFIDAEEDIEVLR